MNKKMFFPKRIEEPEKMQLEEDKVFAKVAKSKYDLWFKIIADHILNQTQFKQGVMLDIACGSGFLVKELAIRRRKSSVFGVDISKTAIGMARKNCGSLKNTFFKIGDVHKLPFKKESVDLIVCRDAFHHFRNPLGVLKEMLRVLKNGGYLYVQDLRRDLPFYLFEQVLPKKDIFQKLQFYSVRASYTKKEIRNLFIKIGKKEVDIYTRYITKKIRKKYKGKKINFNLLRANFQSHYIVLLKKDD